MINTELDKQNEKEALEKYYGEYIKKPVMIEAVLYDGSTESLVALNSAKFGLDPLKVKVSKDGTEKDKIIIPTLEGDMQASVGDYIIKGINGEFYPCKPDIFEKTYSSVTED